jgi:hypothetical protein
MKDDPAILGGMKPAHRYLLIGMISLVALPLVLSSAGILVGFLVRSPEGYALFVIANVVSYFTLTVGGLAWLLILRYRGRFKTGRQKLIYAISIFLLGLAIALGAIALYVGTVFGRIMSGFQG